MSSSLSDLTTCTDNTLSTNEDMITSIDGVAQRINILKRKVCLLLCTCESLVSADSAVCSCV